MKYGKGTLLYTTEDRRAMFNHWRHRNRTGVSPRDKWRDRMYLSYIAYRKRRTGMPQGLGGNDPDVFLLEHLRAGEEIELIPDDPNRDAWWWGTVER